MDDFESEAWDALNAAPDQFYSERQDGPDQTVLRVAVADLMTEEACVACHNSHPETPKVGWQIGDVRGILEIKIDITEDLAAARNLGLVVAGLVMAATFAAAFGLSTYLRRRIFLPLETISDAAHTFATGDTTASVDGIDRGDEIGSLARSLEVFREQASEVQSLYEERARYLFQLETLVDERTADLQRTAEDLSKAFGMIQDSINYASAIQRSILPDLTHLPRIFDDHFVLWEPRDRVGGDIYWCNSWSGGYLIIVADGTGHGVPGAFLTLLASGALDKSMGASMDGDVKTLLARFHIVLQEVLGQHQAGSDSDDGLDVGACYITPDQSRIAFIGAHLDLFMVEEGTVSKFRGDHIGIGYRDTPMDFPFTLHEIPLRAGQRFYLTTDGLLDQIGGAKRIGFGKARFATLLSDIHSLPMLDQGDAINQSLLEYQGEETRRDDVTVLGFRIADLPR